MKLSFMSIKANKDSKQAKQIILYKTSTKLY